MTNRNTEESKSARCNFKCCQVCQCIEETNEFEDADGNKYDIRNGIINCNADFTFSSFCYRSCSKQYVGSSVADFCCQFNNYKSAFWKVSKSGKPSKVNQEYIHLYFKLPRHNGMGDWRVTLKDRADNRKELRRRESFWQYKVKTL